jgi:hypothetical protein
MDNSQSEIYAQSSQIAIIMSPFPLLLFVARSFFAPRLELMAEVPALRQQLAILNRTAKRLSLRFQDRLFWGTLARFWQDWRSALLIVKPVTVSKNTPLPCVYKSLLSFCEKESASGAMNWSNKTGEHPVHLYEVGDPT